MEPWSPEFAVKDDLARALIEPYLPVQSLCRLGEGWDNTAFLVNKGYVFRFPRRQVAVELLGRESLVLPEIGGKLSLPIPVPIFKGEPTQTYPWPFHGYAHIPGQTACGIELSHKERLALAPGIGLFLKNLHALPVNPAWPLGAQRVRGSLQVCIDSLKTRISEIATLGVIDQGPKLLSFLNRVDDTLLEEKGCCLVHGDLYARHLLIENGKLRGMIDWGDMHIGDPAVDLVIAHSFLPPEAHASFREAYGPMDRPTWLRAQLWAIYHCVTLCWYGSGAQVPELVRVGGIGLDFITGSL
jgi:aminoglycoside phosphotransferase (APT) family kinase protein